jgi:hypothetical protein
MRTIHDPATRSCYACGERADVVVQRDHRTWYACWDHADDVLAYGGVIVGGDLRGRSARSGRSG